MHVCHDHTHNRVAKQKGDVTSLSPYKNVVPRFSKEKERRNTGFDYLLEPYGSLLEEVER